MCGGREWNVRLRALGLRGDWGIEVGGLGLARLEYFFTRLFIYFGLIGLFGYRNIKPEFPELISGF